MTRRRIHSEDGSVFDAEKPRGGLQLPLVPTTLPVRVGIVLVGEQNPYGRDPYYALYDEPANSAGGRLRRKILGMSHRNYLALRRYNLCGAVYRVADARVRAAAIRADHPEATLVLLGRKVASAFGVDAMPAFSIDLAAGYLTLPHPSGRCTAWNEPNAVSRARVALRLAAPDLPLGEEGS